MKKKTTTANKNKNRNRKTRNRPFVRNTQDNQDAPAEKGPLEIVEGVLEVTEKGHGYLRSVEFYLRSRPNDPFVSCNFIQEYRLINGVYIKAQAQIDRSKGPGPQVREILEINGKPPDDFFDRKRFEDFIVIDPDEMIHLETGPEPLGTRIMDMLTPIGKGQRGLIVAPPRTGKTVLLQQIACGVHANHPEMEIVLLLIDERPEEVTDIRRNVPGQVIASSNDNTIENHVRTARLTMEWVKRQVEYGKDVIVLLDSITRLGRAFNAWVGSSGRTMSGGVDIKALQLPKQIFGSARNNEEGGSLTILATALVDTGSRMDELIFQEFKGTGNMELVLDQQLANRRIYPALNLSQSGTRKEERLLDPGDLEKIVRLRRHLDGLRVDQDMVTLIRTLKKHPSNKEFLDALP